MKKSILLTILLIPALCSAQNRVITAKDTAIYHVAKIGDLILDTPTNSVPFADGANKLVYTSISKVFPSFREDGTIWVDGKKLGKVCEFRLLNGIETTPWHVSTVTIRPIPGTRVDGVYTKNSYGGFLYLLQGVKFLKVAGSSKEFPGLEQIESGDFLKGRFGFGATSTGIYSGYHAFSISVLDGGSLDIEGFEAEHGFSGLRFEGGSYDYRVKLKVRNAYIHDTESEGMYLGATHAPPLAKIEMDIKGVLVIRSGSEGLQLQHMIGNTWVRNVTIAGTDAGYISQFQMGQDTGLQLNPDEGNAVIEKISVDTWGSHGANLFGSPSLSTVKNCTVKNIAFLNGRGEGVYPHNSCTYGMNWVLDSLYFGNLTREYFINSKTKATTWVISKNSGTDIITTTNVNYDAPAIEYVNSGFYETQNNVKFYRKTYAKYISGTDTTRVWYRVGQIIVDREPGKLPVFTKCVKNHITGDIRPKNDLVNYIILSWDGKGVRSDQPNFNHLSTQKLYPPDDFRVKNDNVYGKLGIGFVQPKVDPAIIIAQLKLENTQLKLENDSLRIQVQKVLDDLKASNELNNEILESSYQCQKDKNQLVLDKQNILNEIQTVIDQHK